MPIGAVQLVPYRTQALETAWHINAAKSTENTANMFTLIHICRNININYIKAVGLKFLIRIHPYVAPNS